MTQPSTSREDLKKQIRALDHELELTTFINKGAISEVRELKTRVAELEQENAAFRNTERRLTQTEERLEESEEAIKEKEDQISRLKEAVNGLKSSLRDAVRERDEWSNRWGRAADFFAKEEEDIADTAMDQATVAFNTVSSLSAECK
jgi:chromosome segregation ATPase